MKKKGEVIEKKPKKPNPATRKRFILPAPGTMPEKLDPDLIFKLAESMLPIESIAIILGCCKDTLYRLYSDVLQKARDGRKKSLSVAMWEKALIEKNTTMQIWLSKQHLGFKDQIPEEATIINFNINVVEIPK